MDTMDTTQTTHTTDTTDPASGIQVTKRPQRGGHSYVLYFAQIVIVEHADVSRKSRVM